jgi:hypothetical protein
LIGLAISCLCIYHSHGQLNSGPEFCQSRILRSSEFTQGSSVKSSFQRQAIKDEVMFPLRLTDLGSMSVNIGSLGLNRIIYSFVSFVNDKERPIVAISTMV